MDFHGHGTHVAGTVGGYGVDLLGATYAGPWDEDIDMAELRIGPGAAPMVDLYALKIADVAGSSLVLAQGMEWATDPDQDGNFDDHLDVVNISFGGDFGTSADPEALVYANAVQAGVVVVAAAGNAGEVYFSLGGPANTPEVISVAAIHDDGPSYQTLHITAPSTAVADYPVMPADWGVPLDATGLSGELALTVPANGCGDPASPVPIITNDVVGKIAVIDRGVCPFTQKAVNAQLAGAAGVIIVNNVPGAPMAMAYTDYGIAVTVPVVNLGLAAGTTVKGVMATDTVAGTLNNTPRAFTDEPDSIASFSSRGPNKFAGHALLKPDIAAPGAHIMSSVARTGDDGEAWPGTSMATPHVAGLAALLSEGHPTWTPQQVKAALMNTANHDVHVFGDSSSLISPARAGAGRADPGVALAATVFAYDADAPEPAREHDQHGRHVRRELQGDCCPSGRHRRGARDCGRRARQRHARRHGDAHRRRRDARAHA
jgi:subtilisin family serine protease